MARHFVTALNIGSMGFWWWRMPEQVSRYYETLEDLETKSKMEITRSPPLTLNWGPTMRVLTNADLVRVMQCFAAMALPEEREKRVPYGYYLAGVNFLSINDVHWQCEGIAFGNFLQALKAIMQQCGYWDSQTPFQDTLATYFEDSFSGAENSDHMMNLFQMYEAPPQQVDHSKVTIDDAISMKLIFDHFFLREFLPGALKM